MNTKSKELSAEQRAELLAVLKTRFEKNASRHSGIDWAKVQTRLENAPEKLWSLAEMERSGGEPGVVGVDGQSGEVLFFDCSPETPEGRRNLCYDKEALEARKKFPPADSAVNVAQAMGIELLTEEQYLDLQKLGEFDLKTSSWVKTPAEMRKLGGALFMDRRYNRVFAYHNGADSYYGARGFRGWLKV